MNTFDRDKAREVLLRFARSHRTHEELFTYDEALDALAGCVADTPHTDPRIAALSDLFDRAEAHYQKSWSFDYPIVDLNEARAILRGEQLPLDIRSNV